VRKKEFSADFSHQPLHIPDTFFRTSC